MYSAQRVTYQVPYRGGHCTRVFQHVLDHSFRWNYKVLPMGSGEREKGGIVLESDLSKTWALHTLAETIVVQCYNAFLDQCGGGRILPCMNRFAQFSSDGDYVEGGSSAGHRDAWNTHRIELFFTQPCSETTVVLKSRNCRSDDFRLGVDGCILLDHWYQNDARPALN